MLGPSEGLEVLGVFLQGFFFVGVYWMVGFFSQVLKTGTYSSTATRVDTLPGLLVGLGLSTGLG